MKKFLFVGIATLGILFWITYPPQRVQAYQSLITPSLTATHIDSVATLKASIECRIVETEVQLLYVMAKTK